jgi:hypothetical protein
MDDGDQTTTQRRYTRKDLSKLPRGLLKMRTPEEIDSLFDKDGFMLPAIAGVIDTGLDEQVSSRFIRFFRLLDTCTG